MAERENHGAGGDAGARGGAWLEAELGTSRPLIGVIHLPPLPRGPAGTQEDVPRLLDRVRRDAAALSAGGADAVLVENYGDAPFWPEDVPKPVVAWMTRLALVAREESGLPTGVNVLRNDGEAAVSAAAAAGGRFVRVNVYIGARVTDQGVIEGRAHRIDRLRRREAPAIRVLADVRVKHSSPLGRERPLADAVTEAVGRGRADGVILTGSTTGRPPDREELRAAREAASGAPVFAGSGVTPATAGGVLEVADGLIVGTALKRGGETEGPVSEERVRALVEAARGDA